MISPPLTLNALGRERVLQLACAVRRAPCAVRRAPCAVRRATGDVRLAARWQFRPGDKPQGEPVLTWE